MIATQHTLVARMRDGGSDSDWQRFYQLYEKPIMAFAASRSLSEAECSDVLQETMVKMLRSGFSRFDPGKGRFTAFLFNIAKCLVIDAIRRRARRETRHVALGARTPDGSGPLEEQLPDRSDSPADAAERQGQMALVLTVLDFLIEKRCFQPKTIGLFRAVVFEQTDPQEVARTFETSVGNVYEAKRAVLARLRSMLQALDRGLDLHQALAQ